jgi:hypothetical protein
MANPLCHFELMTADPAKCKSFYQTVFGWTFDEQAMPGYTLVQTGADPSGGLFKKPDEALPACINVYFKVTDIAAALKNVTNNGGRVLVPKTEIPNTGHFAIFTDPEGIAIGLMQPLAH